MKIHNPIHPGQFIKEVYLEELDISANKVAKLLNVSNSTLTRLLKGDSNISPEMALRLSKTLGRTPESWLLMQDQYSLMIAEKNLDLLEVEVLKFSA